jgi:hypothetical protein
MAPRFLTILTGRNLPKIWQPREPEPSTINEKMIADFTRVVEQTGIDLSFYFGPRHMCGYFAHKPKQSEDSRQVCQHQ